MHKAVTAPMPDVANQKVAHRHQSIDWVGMGEIHLPVIFNESEIHQQVVANLEVFVNLVNGGARGIHMSRLYLLTETMETCNKDEIIKLLNDCIETQKTISSAARIRMQFPLLIRRKALLSNNSGWRSYPITLEATLKDGESDLHLTVGIDYSSTCPCSKALAEQLICNKFDQDLGMDDMLSRQQVTQWLHTNAIHASPHSQRSHAQIRIQTPEQGEWGAVPLINLVETTLKTAVQSAVKREDEQHFALLNGQNPMFCEDANRLIQNALIEAQYPSFTVQVHHFESLHAHNAIAISSYP